MWDVSFSICKNKGARHGDLLLHDCQDIYPQCLVLLPSCPPDQIKGKCRDCNDPTSPRHDSLPWLFLEYHPTAIEAEWFLKCLDSNMMACRKLPKHCIEGRLQNKSHPCIHWLISDGSPASFSFGERVWFQLSAALPALPSKTLILRNTVRKETILCHLQFLITVLIRAAIL